MVLRVCTYLRSSNLSTLHALRLLGGDGRHLALDSRLGLLGDVSEHNQVLASCHVLVILNNGNQHFVVNLLGCFDSSARSALH